MSRHSKFWGLALLGLLPLVHVSWAVEPMSPPGLLPTEVARSLLAADPGVAAAQANLEVARQEADILDRSPYEWTTKLGSQRRSIQDGSRYGEWNVGVERSVRLPGKAAADRRQGKASIEESEAAYGEALHEAARELLFLWVDWLVAERARELAVTNSQSFQESLATVEKRVRAGDASRLDMSVARAELADQRRMHNEARTQAAVAWSRLSARFPGIPRQIALLPNPARLEGDLAFWRDRILEQSDQLKLAQTQLRKSEALADRARAEKIPDPTLGLYSASEIGGREHISGITISIPIPGGARSSHREKMVAEVEVMRRKVAVEKRRLETGIAAAVAEAEGAYEGFQIAIEGATALQDNAELTQRAYALGEAELQSLLISRRKAIDASNISLMAQGAAAKASFGLLVDAHLIWDMEHD